MSKHSPSPWVINSKTDWGIVINSADGRQIIKSYRDGQDASVRDGFVPDAECTVNTSLIMAAPELLAACKMAEKYFTEKQLYSRAGYMQDVIAAAEGK